MAFTIKIFETKGNNHNSRSTMNEKAPFLFYKANGNHNINTLSKIKVLNRHQWFHEEPQTPIEPFLSTKESL